MTEAVKEEKPVSIVSTENTDEQNEDEGEVAPSPEIHFEPVIKLEQVETHTGEEDDEVVFKARAKMYRFDKEGNEWKERGTGDLKLLKSVKTGQIRVLMRREKTHKICANHLVVKGMELKASMGSDKSWIYQTVADFSEGEARPETLTVRFANGDHAKEFKEKFDEAMEINSKIEVSDADKLSEQVSGLKIDEPKSEEKEAKTEEEKPCCKKEEVQCKCDSGVDCKESGCGCGCQH